MPDAALNSVKALVRDIKAAKTATDVRRLVGKLHGMLKEAEGTPASPRLCAECLRHGLWQAVITWLDCAVNSDAVAEILHLLAVEFHTEECVDALRHDDTLLGPVVTSLASGEPLPIYAANKAMLAIAVGPVPCRKLFEAGALRELIRLPFVTITNPLFEDPNLCIEPLVKLNVLSLVTYCKAAAGALVRDFGSSDESHAFAALVASAMAVGYMDTYESLLQAGLVPALVRSLSHASPFCRSAAAFAVGQVWASDTEAVTPMMQKNGVLRALVRVVASAAPPADAVAAGGIYVKFHAALVGSDGDFILLYHNDPVLAAATMLGHILDALPELCCDVVEAGGLPGLASALTSRPLETVVGPARALALILTQMMAKGAWASAEKLDELRGLNLIDALLPMIDPAHPVLGDFATKILGCLLRIFYKEGPLTQQQSETMFRKLLCFIEPQSSNASSRDTFYAMDCMNGMMALDSSVLRHVEDPGKLVCALVAHLKVMNEEVCGPACGVLLALITARDKLPLLASGDLTAEEWFAFTIEDGCEAVKAGAVPALLRIIRERSARWLREAQLACASRVERSELDWCAHDLVASLMVLDKSVMSKALQDGLLDVVAVSAEDGRRPPWFIGQVVHIMQELMEQPESIGEFRRIGLWPVYVIRGLGHRIYADDAFRVMAHFTTRDVSEAGVFVSAGGAAALGAALEANYFREDLLEIAKWAHAELIKIQACLDGNRATSPRDRPETWAQGATTAAQTPDQAPPTHNQAAPRPAVAEGGLAKGIFGTAEHAKHAISSEQSATSHACHPGSATRATSEKASLIAGSVNGGMAARQCDLRRVRTCAQCGADRGSDGAAKLMECAACRAVRYCGRECQRAHWLVHRTACKASRPHEGGCGC